MTDTFTGIAPGSVLAFISFQVIGAALGALITEVFYPRKTPEPLDLPYPIAETDRSS